MAGPYIKLGKTRADWLRMAELCERAARSHAESLSHTAHPRTREQHSRDIERNRINAALYRKIAAETVE